MDKFSDRRNRLTLIGSCNLDIIVTEISFMVESGLVDFKWVENWWGP